MTTRPARITRATAERVLEEHAVHPPLSDLLAAVSAAARSEELAAGLTLWPRPGTRISVLSPHNGDYRC